MANIAVFFDAENVSAENVSKTINFLESKGDLIFRRAYADWSMTNVSSWKKQIKESPIIPIQYFHDKKEIIDKAIMMDCLEMATTKEEIDTFVLVTSDNGFYTLALRLRELGKRVIGIGEKDKCKNIKKWVRSCNEFKYFEDLEDLEDNKFSDFDDVKDFSIEEFLEDAFKRTQKYKDSNSVLLSQFWESVLRKKPDFNEKQYGASTPLRLVEKYNKLFKLSDDGKNPKTYFIFK